MTLAARGVRHGFRPGKLVLDELDFRLERGEAVALMGANGAGKTTLLRILARLLEPLAGDVRIDDESIAGLDRRDIARRVSVVPQARTPAFGFTALEFVLMGSHSRSRRFSLDGAAQQQAARAALEQMGVAHLEGRPMTLVSGGEAQRIVMARTLVSGAPYWLLDEPTSNLDLRHRMALLDTVRAHCDSGGAALAIVHDPNLVERWFDRVVVLHDGRVSAHGAPRDVLTPSVFEVAFGLRMTYVEGAGVGAWVPDLDPITRAPVEGEMSKASTS